MKLRTILLLLTLTVLASFLGAYLSQEFRTAEEHTSAPIVLPKTTPYQQIIQQDAQDLETGFIKASEVSTPSVVFIKTESERYQRSSFFGFGFDPFGRIGKVANSGSGVVVSQDGYVVTNHHVIKDADKIEVVLSNSKKRYVANLIGEDPSSDLALLKIEANSLTPIVFTNSDDVKIGQWVLAVGNPFNLTSTVTAGIVSAKGRNINIVNNQFPIESFIQTDAAINPGNSGGALVNMRGELVGVNTAIASKTGSYVGYGFAIPANIVGKIIEDLKRYGAVQRAFIGIDVTDTDGEIIEKLGGGNGVLVVRTTGTNDQAANKVKAGDLITKINGIRIDSKSTFDERLAYLRPGDIAKLEIVRDEKSRTFEITLVNKEGTTTLLERKSQSSEVLGAEFELISKLDRLTYGIENGIKVSNITSGKIRKMNLSDGFIFVKVNNKKCTDIDILIKYLENYQGQIRIEGVNANGAKQYLSYNFY